MQTRLFLLRPPEGVSPQEFDRWYLDVHAQEARQIPSICRYLSWQGEQVPPHLMAERYQRYNKWYRLTEVSTWATGQPGGVTYTPPTYEARTEEPLTWWYEDTILIGDRPEYDLLREVPNVGG